tara:strand:+ start:11051 stop:11914 length:864 start_codon:yes stop_codon:yes gene_type:complete
MIFLEEKYKSIFKNDTYEKSRLGKAGLKIPSLKEDFINGKLHYKDIIERHKLLSNKDRNKNILEIGCSWGFFLEESKKFKINPFGIEVIPARNSYVNNKLKIPCYYDLEVAIKKNIKFDKVFIFYTLEHISSPIDFLKKIFQVLEKKGSIFIITPNHNDFLKDYWNNQAFKDFFYEKTSIAYYSVKSIIKLINVFKKKYKYKFKYSVYTEQHYSVGNHFKWHFTNSPSTTGIIGEDKFMQEIFNNIEKNDDKLSSQVKKLFKEFDSSYKKILSNSNYGNQIIFKINK